jgi:hypothetical protein
MILRGLVQLALVRALRPAACVLGAALLAFALATSRSSAAAGLAAGGDSAVLWEHGARRAAGWTVVVLLVLGWLGLQALRTLTGWRRRDVDWLAPRAPSAIALICSSWLGLVAAALLVCGASALAIEACANGGRASWIEGPRAFEGEGGWLESGTARGERLATGALPAGARLRLEFAYASGGPDVRIRAVLADPASGVELVRREGAVGTRGALELELPACPPAALLRLTTTDPELRIYHMAESGRIWLPAAHEGCASLALLARLVLDTSVCCALALALSGWLSGVAAALVLAGFAILSMFSDAGSSGLPLAGLGHALRVLEEGRVPALPAATELARAAALCALGLALGAASLRRWRRERA